ncbi:MAG: pilin [Candidatus Paceibacteria bacterium]
MSLSNFSKTTSFLLILLFLLTFLIYPADVVAQNQNSSGQDGTHGLQTSAKAAGLNKYPSDVNTIAGNVIGWGLSLVGVVFFVLVVYGGILWMTARGNEDQVQRGRNTIIAASIGVVIVLASYAITNFVLQSLQGGQGGGNQASGGSGNSCPTKCVQKATQCPRNSANLQGCSGNKLCCKVGQNSGCPTKCVSSPQQCASNSGSVIGCSGQQFCCK